MQALHRLESTGSCWQKVPCKQQDFSLINQRKKSPLCKSSGEDSDSLKATKALADEAGAAG